MKDYPHPADALTLAQQVFDEATALNRVRAMEFGPGGESEELKTALTEAVQQNREHETTAAAVPTGETQPLTKR